MFILFINGNKYFVFLQIKIYFIRSQLWKLEILSDMIKDFLNFERVATIHIQIYTQSLMTWQTEKEEGEKRKRCKEKASAE